MLRVGWGIKILAILSPQSLTPQTRLNNVEPFFFFSMCNLIYKLFFICLGFFFISTYSQIISKMSVCYKAMASHNSCKSLFLSYQAFNVALCHISTRPTNTFVFCCCFLLFLYAALKHFLIKTFKIILICSHIIIKQEKVKPL